MSEMVSIRDHAGNSVPNIHLFHMGKRLETAESIGDRMHLNFHLGKSKR